MPESKKVKILSVEDDDIDFEALIRAFKKSDLAHQVYRATDGLQALEILRGEKEGKPLPRPNLILLDLNLPRMNGIEFLDALRKDARLKDSVVFIYSTSAADRDRRAAYEKNVAGYLVKAPAGDGCANIVSILKSYCANVLFPPENFDEEPRQGLPSRS